MIRITFNNDFLGPYTTDTAIGINEIVKEFKRSEKNDGIVFQIILSLRFIKDGREYLRRAFELYGGIDAQVSVLLEEYNPNTYKFDQYYPKGEINFNLYNLDEESVEVNIDEGDGFQTWVLNSLEKEIDLETTQSQFGLTIPSTSTIDLAMHSKTLKQRSYYIQELNGDVTVPLNEYQLNISSGSPVRLYAMYSLANEVISEIEDFYDLPSQISDLDPTNALKYSYKAKYGGPATLKQFYFNWAFGLQSVSTHLNITVTWHFKHGKAGAYSDVTLPSSSISNGYFISGTSQLLFPYSFTMEPGDFIFIYAAIDISLTGASTLNGPFEIYERLMACKVELELLSTAPASSQKSILIYEAIKKLVQYATGQTDCFKSNLLGRTDLGYASNGKWSNIAITNGRAIRNYGKIDGVERSKIISASLQYLLDFINSIGCIGWGFETDANGITRFVVEEKAYFYNKNERSISLGEVIISSKLNVDGYWNRVKFGFSTKLEENETNSIDEFLSLREYAIPIVNTPSKLDISSPMKVSGYQIETQRRLIGAVPDAEGNTKDSKLDDELFAISVIYSSGWRAKKNDGYDSITGVFDSTTGYNYDFAPCRTIRNWSNYIASCLTKSNSKVLKFSSGETNYTMTSKRSDEPSVIDEHGNIDLSSASPWFEPTNYEIKPVAVTREQIAVLSANPFKYIEMQDRFGATFKGFLCPDGLKHDGFKKTIDGQLLKAL